MCPLLPRWPTIFGSIISFYLFNYFHICSQFVPYFLYQVLSTYCTRCCCVHLASSPSPYAPLQAQLLCSLSDFQSHLLLPAATLLSSSRLLQFHRNLSVTPDPCCDSTSCWVCPGCCSLLLPLLAAIPIEFVVSPQVLDFFIHSLRSPVSFAASISGRLQVPLWPLALPPKRLWFHRNPIWYFLLRFHENRIAIPWFV